MALTDTNHARTQPAPTPPARAAPAADAGELLHVVQFSGGIGSWATAMRIKAAYGTDRLVLLAADTNAEDPDLWRFVGHAAAHLGVTPVIVADGRTPWQVFADQRFIGNSRIAPCSRILKQQPCRDWLTAHADPATTVLYVGIDWSEHHRTPGIERGWKPWTVRFPMCDPPHLTKAQMLDWARAEGIEPPRAYADGFVHNNCFGACVRAGQRQWLHLLQVAPERFAAAEAEEAHLRAELGDVAILRERRNGVSWPLPLHELRRRATAIPAPEHGTEPAAANRST